MLEDETFRVLSAEVALGGEGREGRVILVLPAAGRGASPVLGPDLTQDEGPQFSAALSAQVMQADCRLDAVVGRLTLPLRQIMALQVGETLALPSSALDAVSLETVEGRHVAAARLGQHRGMRAVKLSEAVSERKAARVQTWIVPVEDEEPPPELRAAG